MCRINYIVLIFFLAFYIQSILADSEVNTKKNSPNLANNPKIFTIGVEDYENWLPYSQFKNGEYSGLGRDILDLFAKKSGYQFHYEVYPLKRRDRMFIDQRLDFSFPDNPSWVPHLKTEVNIRYTPVLEFIDGVMVLKSNQGKGLAALKTLGIPLGFTPYQYLPLIEQKKIKDYTYPNYDSLYQKVALKHIDGAYMNIDIAKYYLGDATQSLGSIAFDPSLPHAKGYWHLASIKYPHIIQEFTLFMQKHYDEIKQLREQYGFSPQH